MNPNTSSTDPNPSCRDQSQLREQNGDMDIEHIARTPPDHSAASSPSPLDMKQQFDLMASKVSETIASISSIYSEIGYSSLEIAEKKSEIFQAMNNTIASFKSSLQREKNSISNECEWLRQQIRIILAMLNDSSGEKHLKLSSRGEVFDNKLMYAEGCKEDVLLHMGKLRLSGVTSFLPSFFLFLMDTPMSPLERLFSCEAKLGSPFSSSRYKSMYLELEELRLGHDVTNPSMNESRNLDDQNEYTLSQNPNLSLLQYKSRLNSIFLEVLKSFMKVYKKFNEFNRMYWENIEGITEEWKAEKFPPFLQSIPNKAEAEEHGALIDEFYTVLEQLKLTNRNYKPELRQGLRDVVAKDIAFIVSSPRKKKHSMSSSDMDDEVPTPTDKGMDKLRDINYKLVHAIRGLKVTKITNEVISQLSKEVEHTEKEIENRVADMKEVISECLHLIEALCLTEADLIAVQRMQNHPGRDKKAMSSGEGLFDIDTLRFIQSNPREFGLMDHHMNFVTKLTRTLQTIKDNKQKKWEQYSQACVNLWDKLGENRSYSENFLEENVDLTDTSLANFKMELKRLYTKRAQYVDSFILDAKRKIFELQTKLLYSEARCREFKYHDYDVNESSDEKEQVLNEHEVEIEKLTADYSEKEPVLSLYAQLNELLEDQTFLSESSRDSSRLLCKNSCKILLNEEKLRKKINKNLPRVLASLKQKTINFNDKLLSKGLRPITAGDDDMLEKILLIESDLSKQANKQSRGKASLPLTSLSVSSTRSPLPKRLSQSPLRVLKPATQKRSPVLSESIQAARRGALRKAAVPRSTISPSQRTESISRQGSFRDTEQTLADKRRGLASTVLMPLNTALAPANQSFIGTLPSSRLSSSSSTNSSNTLYSMCSRVSPLRNTSTFNSSVSSSLFPLKVPGRGRIPEEADKENSFLEHNDKHGYQKHTTAGGENSRLSGESLANSTIAGDDYQSWRDERIKLINGDDLDLC